MCKNLFTAILMVSMLLGCKKEEPIVRTYPTSYNFENVNFSGQTARIKMLSELVTAMGKGTTEEVSATTLSNMYANTGNPFTDIALNTSGKQLKDKTYALDIPLFEDFMSKLAATSLLRTETAAPGIAGTAVSTTDATKKYLVDSNGVEYAQIIQKGLMGAIFYYRIADEYTTSAKLDVADNTTIVPGEGTAMQHYWDEGFGYWGVPTYANYDNYDSTKAVGGFKFYGTYVEKGKAISLYKNLLYAYIQGRTAINENNKSDREIAATSIRKNIEAINACSAISYLNQAIANYNNYAVRCHTLSEAYGFILALKYNSQKTISTEDHNALLSEFKVNNKLSVQHLSSADILALRDELSSIFDLDSIKSTL